MASFLQIVAEKYGNKKAKWCDGPLETGQKVKVIFELNGESVMIDGVSAGKRTRKNVKNHAIKITNPSNGRKCVIRPPSYNILVVW